MPAPGKIGSTGHAPTVLIRPISETPTKKEKVVNIKEVVRHKMSGEKVAELLEISSEQQKYLKCWNVPDYRKVSPGAKCVDMFLEVLDSINPNGEKQTLFDLGCGTGRGGYKLWQTGKFDVTLMDFAWNCLDADIKARIEGTNKVEGLSFFEHDLTKKTHHRAEWGYCCDVLEHLPTDQIDAALESMFETCDNLFLQIATIPDYFGGHPGIKEQLHLTVWNYERWLKKFAEHGVVVHRSMESKHHVIFCVSGYQGFAFDKMKMNTAAEVVYDQIRTNLNKGLNRLTPFAESPDQKVIVLGGGPSLNDYVDEIKEHKKNGAKIVTMNGTYGWAKEHDLWPVTQFMIDAREFNTRFVDPVDEKNVYVIAAQCHPDLVDKLPKDRTYISNCNLDPGSIEICNELLGDMYDFEGWFPVPGGSTVMLRCLPALKMMGFRDIEIYGFDSCFRKQEHHAYPQTENDIPDMSDDRVAFVDVKGTVFAVEPWQLCQANEFIHLRQLLLKELNIKIHGDGLIAHCIETGVDILEGKEQ